jgi:hypothetical protein
LREDKNPRSVVKEQGGAPTAQKARSLLQANNQG